MFSSAHFEMSKSIGQKIILMRNVPKPLLKNQERLRATPFFLAVGISCKNLAHSHFSITLTCNSHVIYAFYHRFLHLQKLHSSAYLARPIAKATFGA